MVWKSSAVYYFRMLMANRNIDFVFIYEYRDTGSCFVCNITELLWSSCYERYTTICNPFIPRSTPDTGSYPWRSHGLRRYKRCMQLNRLFKRQYNVMKSSGAINRVST
jgi:hypothetical protein